MLKAKPVVATLLYLLLILAATAFAAESNVIDSRKVAKGAVSNEEDTSSFNIRVATGGIDATRSLLAARIRTGTAKLSELENLEKSYEAGDIVSFELNTQKTPAVLTYRKGKTVFSRYKLSKAEEQKWRRDIAYVVCTYPGDTKEQALCDAVCNAYQPGVSTCSVDPVFDANPRRGIIIENDSFLVAAKAIVKEMPEYTRGKQAVLDIGPKSSWLVNPWGTSPNSPNEMVLVVTTNFTQGEQNSYKQNSYSFNLNSTQTQKFWTTRVDYICSPENLGKEPNCVRDHTLPKK